MPGVSGLRGNLRLDCRLCPADSGATSPISHACYQSGPRLTLVVSIIPRWKEKQDGKPSVFVTTSEAGGGGNGAGCVKSVATAARRP